MKVVLKDVRIAFCQSLFAAEQYQGKGVFRHSSTFLIVPGSDNDKALEAAILAEATAKWPKKGAAMVASLRPQTNKFCYQDGNTKEYEGWEGMKALGAHRKQSDGRPTVLDEHKNPLVEADGKPYGGCYVNASVDIYAQDGENSGIRCGLVAVQFWRNGDSFGGARKSQGDEFEAQDAGSDASALV